MHKQSVVHASALSIVMVVAFSMPLILWQDVLRYLPIYLQGGAPAGQSAYLVAKLTGTMALILLLVQLLLALLGRLTAFRGLRLSGLEHRRLGIATVSMSLLHALTFALATSLRTEHLAWKVLTPVFSDGYWRSLVSVGWVALMGLLIAATAGFWRARRQWTGAIWLHRVGAAFGLLALWHSIAIGSESTMVVVLASILMLGGAVLVWVGRRVRGRVGRQRAAGDAA